MPCSFDFSLTSSGAPQLLKKHCKYQLLTDLIFLFLLRDCRNEAWPPYAQAMTISCWQLAQP